MEKKLRPAVFLDRDGTLNLDTGYVCRVEDWQWLPEVPRTLARLKAAGWLLLVVSNQSGVARGYFDMQALSRMEDWIMAQLRPLRAEPDGWYYCPHLPSISGPCQCRKPAPGLILQAAREHGADLARSWMVGNSLRDAQAGLAAGCRPILLNAHWTEAQTREAARLLPQVPQCPDLAAASALILAEPS